MSYKIRTTCPNNNKYYMTTSSGGWNRAIKGSPTRAGADVLANCVGFCNGRWNEVLDRGRMDYQFICNAENFIEKAKQYGLEISSTPVEAGIMVWEGKGSLAGHVAFVERVDNANQVYTSESAYGGSAFYNATRNNNNGRWGMGTNYSFRGCIVNPEHPHPEPTPTPSGNKTIKYIQETLNQRYGTGLNVDGYYGNLTHKALVKGLQHELNVQFNKGLVEDGIFGNATRRACNITVRYGARGNITWLIQAMLYCRGYNPNGIDGIFGSGCQTCVIQFQKNNGLSRDGVVGQNTFDKLFR